MRFAGDMQKEVTVKRGEIDALQTKIHWLEECLDAALRVRADASNSSLADMHARVDRAWFDCYCDGIPDVPVPARACYRTRRACVSGARRWARRWSGGSKIRLGRRAS